MMAAKGQKALQRQVSSMWLLIVARVCVHTLGEGLAALW